MAVVHQLLRMLVGVILWATASLLAPSIGLAHGGHGHEAAAPAASRWISVTADVANAKSDVVLTREARLSKAACLQDRASDHRLLLPTTEQNCLADCCQSAGMACCAAFAPVDFDLVLPVRGPLLLDRSAIEGAGIDPGALPEPPKPLV